MISSVFFSFFYIKCVCVCGCFMREGIRIYLCRMYLLCGIFIILFVVNKFDELVYWSFLWFIGGGFRGDFLKVRVDVVEFSVVSC